MTPRISSHLENVSGFVELARADDAAQNVFENLTLLIVVLLFELESEQRHDVEPVEVFRCQQLAVKVFFQRFCRENQNFGPVVEPVVFEHAYHPQRFAGARSPRHEHLIHRTLGSDEHLQRFLVGEQFPRVERIL